MKLLDGKELAKAILQDTAALAEKSKIKNGIQAALAIVTATNDESSQWYVRSIAKKAESVGVDCRIISLGPDAAEFDIAGELTRLARDEQIHGIILQTPLPAGVNPDNLLSLIPAAKDVDGANPESIGRLVSGLEAFAPATAAAVMAILDEYKVKLQGKKAVVIGRSRIVGKPAAHLLLDRHATVTICHSRTQDLPGIARAADVLVVAIGKAVFITSDFVGDNAVVIDVGTNVDASGNLVGDVDFESVQARDIALSPVPGGVGPVTTAILLQHTATAASKV